MIPVETMKVPLALTEFGVEIPKAESKCENVQNTKRTYMHGVLEIN